MQNTEENIRQLKVVHRSTRFRSPYVYTTNVYTPFLH